MITINLSYNISNDGRSYYETFSLIRNEDYEQAEKSIKLNLEEFEKAILETMKKWFTPKVDTETVN